MKKENLETINDTRSWYRICCSCELQKSHCISSMLHRTLLDPHLSPHTCLWSLYCSSVAILRCVLSLPLCKECFAVSDCLNNQSFSQIMITSLLLKSAANTLRLIYFRERAVSTTTLTISRPLWMHLKFTTTEIGQLTSPLFSQEREVSANPFCVLVLRHI